MKVLFWADGFWPRLGGTETMGLQLIEGMQARGHQYRVVAQRDHPSWKEDDTYRGIPIKRFDFNGVIGKQNLGLMHSIQTYLEWVMSDFQPDIIHLNACDRGSVFVFLLFLKLFRVPIVLTAHAPYLQGKADHIQLSPIMAKIALAADRICCVSNWVLTEIEKVQPEVKEKLTLIYNGLPMPEITPSPLSFSPPTLLAFGRLSWEKGFDTAVKAFGLLKKSGSNARLIIGGGGPERPALEKLVSELGIEDSVTFLGVLTEEGALSVFNQATLVVVPSILESFGLVILASMQMQRPVIASRVQGVPEVISEGEAGLLFPRQDAAALCEAIQSLLLQPEKAVQMGIEGRKRAMQFTLQQNVLQSETVYKELERI